MFNKVLTTGSRIALTLTIGFLTFLPGPASATQQLPEYYFYPGVAWDTRTIEKNGRQICSIATEMNNGFIMQITGADQKFQTINFNFRQDVFSGQDSVEVTLSVPGKMTKTLPAFVAKPELIAIDTKLHQDLIKEIRTSNVLDLYVGKNGFRFYLTGLEQGLKPFDKCLGLDTKAPFSSARSEPVRQAPSFNAQKVAEDAKRQYENEMAMLMGELNDDKPAGVVPIKEVLPDNHQMRMNDNTANMKKPEAPRSRFTERLAAEMAKVEGDSLEGGIKIPKASSENIVRPQAATKVQKAETDVKSIPLQASQPKEADMTQKAQAASKVATQKQPADKPGESIQWRDDRVTPGSATEEKTAAAPKAKVEAVQDLPPLESYEPPAPVRRVTKTADPVVNKRSARIEADFTDAGLEERPAHTNKPAMEVTVTPERSTAALDSEVVREMQIEIAKLKAENAQLNKELEKSLRASETERLDVSTDNWNLEQATMRYNEAERQIAALGLKIQKERAQWEMEKAELEMMLFDPAVTEKAQLARLATLEKQLNEAKAELEDQRKDYEERLRKMRMTMQRSAPVSQ